MEVRETVMAALVLLGHGNYAIQGHGACEIIGSAESLILLSTTYRYLLLVFKISLVLYPNFMLKRTR